MGFTVANVAATPLYAGALVQIGDQSRTAPTQFKTVVAANPAGTTSSTSTGGVRIDRIEIESAGPSVLTTLRLWKYDTVNLAWYLYDEIQLGTSSPTASNPYITLTREAVTAPTLYPIVLGPTFALRATVNDTQIGQGFSPNNVFTSLTPTGAANNFPTGALFTAASTAAICASQTPGAAGDLTLVTTAGVTLPNQGFVSITSASNVSATTFTLQGEDMAGNIVTETLVGPNITTVFSVNQYKTVRRVAASQATGAAVTVGYGATALLTMPGKLSLTSLGNVSGTNFTFTGTTAAGVTATEVLAGPNAGTVTSANTYIIVGKMVSSATPGSAVEVGSAIALSGIYVGATGGLF